MSSLPPDLRSTASLNYSSLQVFFPALAQGEELLTPEERASHDALVIPNTILYNYGKPVERYSSDPVTGGVVRIHGRLTTEGIWDELSMNQCPTTRRSAMWMEEASEATAELSQMRDVLVDVTCQEPGPRNLRVFLQRVKGKGMLQQVVENKRESDGSARCSMFLCHYSQHRFSVDKLTSLYQIAGVGGVELPPPPNLVFSPHFGSYNVTVVPASRTFTQIRRLSDRVALCLARYYKAKVVTMTLGFRFDAKEQLYLSWCDSASLCLMTPSGPCTFTMDAHGTRLANSPQVRASAKDTKFSLRDPRDEVFPCAVCHAATPRGELCRVQLRWLLMGLSLMDGYVKGWQGEVPPSVALVCPDLTVEAFRSLKETIATQPLFKLLCGDCFGRTEVAIQHMTVNKMAAPAWLGVDSVGGPRRRLTQARARASVGGRCPSPNAVQGGVGSADGARPRKPHKVCVVAAASGGEGSAAEPPIDALPLYTHREGRWQPARTDALVIPNPPPSASAEVIVVEGEEDGGAEYTHRVARALARAVPSSVAQNSEGEVDSAELQQQHRIDALHRRWEAMRGAQLRSTAADLPQTPCTTPVAYS